MNPSEKSPELSLEEQRIIRNLIDGKESALDEILSLSIKKNDLTIKKSKLNSVEEKIQEALIYGGSTTFNEDIDEALKQYSPIDIIEKILIPGMEKIGKMFENGELYLPQLIRSASVMNKSIDILTPLFEQNHKIQL